VQLLQLLQLVQLVQLLTQSCDDFLSNLQNELQP
jgi:hypothetical protein